MKLPWRDVPPRATVVVIALVLLAGIVTARETSPAPEAMMKTSMTPSEATRPPATVVDVKIEPRQRVDERADDLFASRSWLPKVPPSPQPPPADATAAKPEPEAPKAPPLPFRYLGQLESKNAKTVFLLKGEDILFAADGDTLETDYKIASISDTGIAFVYLPLGITQTLAIPAAAPTP